MRRKRDFALAIRRGRRAARRTLVAHLLVRPDERNAPLVGFVVSRAVGGAVVRNRVRRRLRHICRARISRLPQGSLLVVRANPSAAGAVHEQLVNDLDDALDRLSRRTERRPGAR